jgi:hypothetical protein
MTKGQEGSATMMMQWRGMCGTIITQRHVENPLAFLEQGFVRVYLGPP